MKRKEFIKITTASALGSLIIPKWLLPGISKASGLREIFNDRIIVLINLGGGNDGLNTIIPFSNPAYYNLRPTIAINENSLLPISPDIGLHPALEPIIPLWDAGEMAILQNVGYPQQDLSHFRSTDIWRSASDSNELIHTGWIARFLESEFPDYASNPPEDPLALQQSSSNLLLLTANDGVTGIIVDDPASFAALVGATYDSDSPYAAPETSGGDELTYVRQIDSTSFAYADIIQQAAQAGMNTVEYPFTGLGNQLKIIAQLLSGGMYSPFFLTHQYGYDTHADQPAAHNNLLSELAGAVGAFYSDLNQLGLADRVITVTTSEFGRRPFENGSTGTDHGAGAPQFFFGPGVNPGIYGTIPDLINFDENDNLIFEYDFRQVYATLLSNWFGTNSNTVSNVLSGEFQPINIIQPISTLGDSNMDGSVNVLDVVLAISFILGNENPSTSQFQNSDMNQDGELNILDIVLIVDHIIGGTARKSRVYSQSNIQLGHESITIPAQNGIGGIQLELSGDFQLEKAILPSGWEWKHNDQTVLIFSQSGTEMTKDIKLIYSGVAAVDNALIADWKGEAHFPVVNGLPGRINLYPIYPNPFNPSAQIKFYLAQSDKVTITIINLKGRVVEQLLNNRKLKQGYHEINWTPIALASGAYFLKLRAGKTLLTQKLKYLK